MKKVSSIIVVLVVLFGIGARAHASIASDLYVKTQGLLSQVQQSLLTIPTRINSAVSEGVQATLDKTNDLIAQIEQVRGTLPASALPALDAAKKSLSTAAIDLDNKERVATQVPLGYVFTTGATMGANGEYVKRIQTVLKENGYFTGSVTGSFGPITKAAVAAYQADHGLSAIGSVGPATAAKLTEDAKVLGVCAGVEGPSIKVLSPNGGQTYRAGQSLTVVWRKCNFSTTIPVTLGLDIQTKDNAGAYSVVSQFPQQSSTSNMQTVVLPSNLLGAGYVIHVAANVSGVSISDYSDAPFSIIN